MKELIKITEKDGNNVVSARELHKFLESKQDFSTWIKSRINKYGFVENKDFTLHKFVERGSWRHEYALTVNTAKEIAMVEGNEKGKQARRYFIECERKLKSSTQKQLPQNYLEALKSLVVSEEKRLFLESENKELKPKAEYYDNTLMSSSTMTTTQIAKELGLSARSLNKKLHELGVQYKAGGQWVLYSKYQDKDFVKSNTYTKVSNDNSRTYHSTVWTERGRKFIYEILKK